jgi:hypothetical protein
MKKLILFLAAIFTLVACSNEFDLTEDWKDITVVYGLLDQSQEVQYIRIEKAFLDPNTSAITIAQTADSLYYENITVQLQAFRTNGTGGNAYTLQRVNAEDEGFTREDGTFATSPNYLYKFTEPIDQSFTYRLVITKNDGEEIEAETGICEDFEITSPFDTTLALRFKAGAETLFRWNSKTNMKFFNANLLIEIKESENGNPNDFTIKTLNWRINEMLKPNQNGLVRASIMGENFYTFLASELEPGYSRELLGIKLQVGAGAQDLLNYLEIGQVNSGITGADVIPTYTNISGDSHGIFSSRFYKTFGTYQIDAPTLDSLKGSYKTVNLGF